MMRRRVNQFSRLDARMLVIGGETTAEFPECCLIGNTSSDGVIWSFSGVLVHKRVVLTAGHCWKKGSEADIVAVNATNKANLAGAEVIRAVSMTPHPEFKRAMTHDIAVMILKDDCTGTKPVGIASDELRRATEASIVGFGDANPFHDSWGIKRVAPATIRSVQREPGVRTLDEDTFGFDSALEFVAGGNGQDVCNHDSGGPAYIAADDGTRKVAGITRRTIRPVAGLSSCGDGSVFSRIDVNLGFIQEVTRGIWDF